MAGGNGEGNKRSGKWSLGIESSSLKGKDDGTDQINSRIVFLRWWKAREQWLNKLAKSRFRSMSRSAATALTPCGCNGNRAETRMEERPKERARVKERKRFLCPKVVQYRPDLENVGNLPDKNKKGERESV